MIECTNEGGEVAAITLFRRSGLEFGIWRFLPSTEEAIFYCSEIISGLIAIHAMGIVHLDIKSENILLSNAGHDMISDFDCAYELAYNVGPPKPKDYRETWY